MVHDLDVVLALLYEDLDESSHFLLRGLVGHQTPALDDFGYGVTQAFSEDLWSRPMNITICAIAVATLAPTAILSCFSSLAT